MNLSLSHIDHIRYRRATAALVSTSFVVFSPTGVKNSNSDKVSKRKGFFVDSSITLLEGGGDWRQYLRNYSSFTLCRYLKKKAWGENGEGGV